MATKKKPPVETPKLVNEPRAQPEPLLPPRWWDQNRAATPSAPAPAMITVSPQVAEVLNIGIDRAIDVATRLRGDYEYVQDSLNKYRWNEERLRSFLRNALHLLGSATSTTIVERNVAVMEAIGTVLEEPMP